MLLMFEAAAAEMNMGCKCVTWKTHECPGPQTQHEKEDDVAKYHVYLYLWNI